MTREVLIVGGPRDGQVMQLSAPAIVFPAPIPYNPGPAGPSFFDPPYSSYESVVAEIQRFFWIFPGRTDRQIFWIAVWPTADDLPIECRVERAALAAWTRGWTPPQVAAETASGRVPAADLRRPDLPGARQPGEELGEETPPT
jgi:hypothetical protein